MKPYCRGRYGHDARIDRIVAGERICLALEDAATGDSLLPSARWGAKDRESLLTLRKMCGSSRCRSLARNGVPVCRSHPTPRPAHSSPARESRQFYLGRTGAQLGMDRTARTTDRLGTASSEEMLAAG